MILHLLRHKKTMFGMKTIIRKMIFPIQQIKRLIPNTGFQIMKTKTFTKRNYTFSKMMYFPGLKLVFVLPIALLNFKDKEKPKSTISVMKTSWSLLKFYISILYYIFLCWLFIFVIPTIIYVTIKIILFFWK